MVVVKNQSDLKEVLREHVRGSVVRATLRDATPGVGFHELFENYAIATTHETKEMEALRKVHPVLSIEHASGAALERTHETDGKDPLSDDAVLSRIGELPGPEHYILAYELEEESYADMQKQGWKPCGMPPQERRAFDRRDAFGQMAKEADIRTPDSHVVTDCTKETVAEFLREHGSTVLQEMDGTAGMGINILHDMEDVTCLTDKDCIGVRRLSKYVHGSDTSCTGCIINGQVIVSPVRHMIIGCQGVASRATQFCGNDWNMDLPKEATVQHQEIVRKLGALLMEKGYKGIFGVDAIWNEEDRHIYALEINPRLLGSGQLYALQQMERDEPVLLGLHLLSFLDVSVEVPAEIQEQMTSTSMTGSHLILRNLLGKTVQVNGDVEPGIYTLATEGIRFERPGIFYSDIQNADEYLVTMVPYKGRTIGPDAQLIRVQMRSQCYDAGKRELLPSAKQFVDSLRHNLDLTIL